jgi:hypothetical protein
MPERVPTEMAHDSDFFRRWLQVRLVQRTRPVRQFPPPLCGLANTESSSVGYGLCSRQFDKTLDSRKSSGTGLREASVLQSPTCCITIERMTWTSNF